MAVSRGPVIWASPRAGSEQAARPGGYHSPGRLWLHIQARPSLPPSLGTRRAGARPRDPPGMSAPLLTQT